MQSDASNSATINARSRSGTKMRVSFLHSRIMYHIYEKSIKNRKTARCWLPYSNDDQQIIDEVSTRQTHGQFMHIQPPIDVNDHALFLQLRSIFAMCFRHHFQTIPVKQLYSIASAKPTEQYVLCIGHFVKAVIAFHIKYSRSFLSTRMFTIDHCLVIDTMILMC